MCIKNNLKDYLLKKKEYEKRKKECRYFLDFDKNKID